VSKAISYARFSHPDQLKGDSLRRQLEASKQYAAEHQLELIENLEDRGISAFRGKNRTDGALSKFLELAKARKIEPGTFLLVESLDRISRENVLAALTLFLQIMEAQIVVVTLVDQQVYSYERLASNPMPLMLSLTIMMRAHEESQMKSIRVSRAWQNKRRDANLRKLTRQAPGWLTLSPDRLRFELIASRVAIVQRIFEECAAGLGRRAIAKRLNKNGFPPFRGKRGWPDSSVQKILENDAVIGVFQPCRLVSGKRIPEGEPIRDYYPKIIQADLFWRARGAQTKRQRVGAGRKGHTFSNLVTGLARCGECDKTMVFVNKGRLPKGGKYLVCGAALRGLCDNNVHFLYEPLELNLIDILIPLDLKRLGVDEGQVDTYAADLDALDAQINDTKQRTQRFIQTFENTPSDLIADRIRQLISERDILGLRRRELANKMAIVKSASSGKRESATIDLVMKIKNTADPEVYKERAALAQEFRRVIRDIRFLKSNHQIVVALNSRPDTNVSCLFVDQKFSHLAINYCDDSGDHQRREIYARGIELANKVKAVEREIIAAIGL
jgi:DNA invertase Pin-like site-specific DNA recombinase